LRLAHREARRRSVRMGMPLGIEMICWGLGCSEKIAKHRVKFNVSRRGKMGVDFPLPSL
jgi:hypothetical protein